MKLLELRFLVLYFKQRLPQPWLLQWHRRKVTGFVVAAVSKVKWCHWARGTQDRGPFSQSTLFFGGEGVE